MVGNMVVSLEENLDIKSERSQLMGHVWEYLSRATARACLNCGHYESLSKGGVVKISKVVMNITDIYEDGGFCKIGSIRLAMERGTFNPEAKDLEFIRKRKLIRYKL